MALARPGHARHESVTSVPHRYALSPGLGTGPVQDFCRIVAQFSCGENAVLQLHLHGLDCVRSKSGARLPAAVEQFHQRGAYPWRRYPRPALPYRRHAKVLAGMPRIVAGLLHAISFISVQEQADGMPLQAQSPEID